jgi:DNA polymerase III delta prime subunit
MSLVEFPGVLLPGFEPTLRALQSISESQNLPFPDLLLPADSSTGGKRSIPPPAYALKRGFVFNLRCLMNNGKDFHVRAGQPVDVEYLHENSSLDGAQAEALVHSLQHTIGIIQGPPGTGKSYTGVALIKALLANRVQGKTRLGPIICVTYTNHALDQLLEALIDKGVTSQIVRIGSRSRSERLQQFNIRKVAQNIDRTRLEKSSQWSLYGELKKYTKDFDALGLRETTTATRLRAYLRENYSQHYSALFGENDDGYQIVTNQDPQVEINKWLQDGAYDSPVVRSVDHLQMVNPLQMCRQERQVLYEHWIQEMTADMHDEVIQLTASHAETKSDFDDIRDEVNLRCLNEAHIIGLTTSGLARNLSMLRNLQSKVVLCEEAGEVLEAHLLTALLPSVEHTILIGDHLQLRPQIHNHELSRENPLGGEKYSLDVSLFERLVDSESAMGSNLPFCTLETQRRMHPSIAQLVRDTLYPRLSDDPSVADYPDVVGMRRRLFWLDHRVPEGGSGIHDAMATTHWNQHEIDMTIGLVSHLVRQGKYHSNEIAVLTPYLGQLHRLRQILGRSFAISLGEQDQEDLDNAGFEDETAAGPTIRTTLLRTLRVATIDNFQGEEAKVVIISLVRSNPQNCCGFLRTPNRINVLLSRAQHGMYIIRNSATSEHVPMWANVLEILRRNENIGPALELQCPRHPDTPIYVSEPDDFTRVSPEGGCDLRCVHRLACGHACKQKCHSNILHNAVYCIERCQRPLKGCSHECPKRCGDACPSKCTVDVFQADRTLECGHVVQNLPCWQSQNLKAVKCTVMIEKQVPSCHHTVSVAFHIDVTSHSFQCGTLCG